MRKLSRAALHALVVCLLPLWVGAGPLYTLAGSRKDPAGKARHGTHHRHSHQNHHRRPAPPGTRTAMSSDEEELSCPRSARMAGRQALAAVPVAVRDPHVRRAQPCPGTPAIPRYLALCTLLL